MNVEMFLSLGIPRELKFLNKGDSQSSTFNVTFFVTGTSVED